MSIHFKILLLKYILQRERISTCAHKHSYEFNGKDKKYLKNPK